MSNETTPKIEYSTLLRALEALDLSRQALNTATGKGCADAYLKANKAYLHLRIGLLHIKPLTEIDTTR